MRHLFSCPLRWSDMDAFGHVNNTVFVRYLEEARIDFMWRPAPGETEASLAGGSVVARHEIDYLRPLVHRHEPVTVELWVTKVAAAATTIAYEVKDEDVVYARASTVVVPYDLDAGRPRRLTPSERAFLQQYLEEDGPGGDGATGRQKGRAVTV
ncbi:acyl-CoA thioesterase [Streptomyces sp. NPDC059740]|uniref:acyl-CoA thioesterase n=1 Tax=Streptomyces sp. NPDC059740 TaxID=3346926 RepID=UPI00364D9A7D